MLSANSPEALDPIKTAGPSPPERQNHPFVLHTDLLWMVRQIDGQKIRRDKLIRKFKNHVISSLLPYYDGIDSLFETTSDKQSLAAKIVQFLQEKTDSALTTPAEHSSSPSWPVLKRQLIPQIITALQQKNQPDLARGARVMIRPESTNSAIRPESEGFITEKSANRSRVRFYLMTGRHGTEVRSQEIPDRDLQIVTLNDLLNRHHDLEGIAHYFFNDAMIRVMKSRIDASVSSFAAHLGIQLLIDKGFIRSEGDNFVSVPGRIFPVLAPKMEQTYRNESLFSSHSLSAPPSERKPHVLRLELTTGCDYNRCTFCTEYAALTPVTKSFDEFREHADRVAASIGAEKSRIQRLFIGSGNSLRVETGPLLDALNYAGDLFNPQRISLYARTASILEKSVDELKQLKDAGLCLVYWGLESGSDDVLRSLRKDCTCDDMIEASKKLAAVGIEVSAMMMPGAGGLKLSESHIAGTQKLLNHIDIKYLTLLSINPEESSLYTRQMQSESDNRALTPDEVNVQVYRLLTGLNPTGLNIGMFTEEIDQVSSNSMSFNSQFTAANKELWLRELRQTLKISLG